MKKFFTLKGRYAASSVFALSLAFLLAAGPAEAALTFSATSVVSDAALTLNPAAASNTILGSTATSGTIAIGGTSGTGTITLGQATTAQTVDIQSAASSTGAQTINIGNGTTGAAMTINVLSGTGTAGAGVLAVADNPRVTTVSLANGANAAAMTVNIASGAAAASRTVTISGGVPTTGTDTLNLSTGNYAKTTNIGTGTAVNTINIGTGGTGVDVITLGDTSAVLNIDGGSTAACTSATTCSELGFSVTRATGATGSFQPIWADLTYAGAAGGTSTYHAGLMGNFLGDTLTNTNATIHAGTIGKYSVTTSDALVGPKAGLVGEAETSVANAAILAVLGGDGGAITPGAAYAVRYLNSTPGAAFTYGLDLFSAAVGSYLAVSYGTADIRLQNGEIITNAVDGTVRIGGAAGNTLDIGSAASNASIRSGTAVPSSCSSGDIFIDIDADPTALFVCDANEDGDGEFDPVTITD